LQCIVLAIHPDRIAAEASKALADPADNCAQTGITGCRATP
jgi:hypothetical protein